MHVLAGFGDDIHAAAGNVVHHAADRLLVAGDGARRDHHAVALDQLDMAMIVDRKPLASEKEIAALFTGHGVSEADFTKACNSFGVSSQVRQAVATAKSAQITGTPALVVNGKYHVSGSKAGGQANMLKVVDFLIEKERAAQGS